MAAVSGPLRLGTTCSRPVSRGPAWSQKGLWGSNVPRGACYQPRVCKGKRRKDLGEGASGARRLKAWALVARGTGAPIASRVLRREKLRQESLREGSQLRRARSPTSPHIQSCPQKWKRRARDISAGGGNALFPRPRDLPSTPSGQDPGRDPPSRAMLSAAPRDSGWNPPASGWRCRPPEWRETTEK